jgi:glycerol-3-phosphate O-acyltransferase
VIQCTHITAHSVLNLLRKANANVDFVRLLRGGGRIDDLALRDVYAEVRRLLDQLRGLKQRGGVRLGPVAETGAAEDVVEDGLRHFSIYHASPAVSRRGDRVSSGDRALLFYYSNRLEGYRLERDTGLRSPLTADHRALAKGV